MPSFQAAPLLRMWCPAVPYHLPNNPGRLTIGSFLELHMGISHSIVQDQSAKHLDGLGQLGSLAMAYVTTETRHFSTAMACADDDTFDSPYTTAARAEGYDLPFWDKVLKSRLVDGKLSIGQLIGGKLDDITVIVAVSDTHLTLPTTPYV